jgi:hypothetical protein
MRKLVAVFALFFVSTSTSHAQVNDLNRILVGGIEDSELLLTRYMEPFARGFGAGVNSGWTNSARPHSILGFHVRVGTGIATVPSGDRGFEITQTELNQLRLLNPELGASPTVAGGRRDARYRFAVEANGEPTGQEFTMPPGTGFAFVPAPMIQAGIGLVRGTSVMVRGFPTVGLGRFGTVGSFGVGVQHGLNQWIPGGSLLPINVSVLAGFTTMSMTSGFEDATNDDQELAWRTNAWTINLLAGRSLLLFDAYGGLGYERSSSDLQLLGTYTVAGPSGSSVTVRDPIDISLSGSNNVKAFVGVGLNLALLRLRAEYTIAEYPTFNAGLSLSLR